MKANVHPAVVVVLIVCVVAVVGFFLFKASTDKPAYPGLNAPHPSGESMNTSGRPISQSDVSTHGISGAPPGSAMPAASPGH